MRFRLAIVSCGVAALVGASVLHGQGTTLRYKWQKGDEVRYRLTQQGTTSMSGVPGAGDMTVEQNFVQVMRMTVQEVAADGSATVRQTFEPVRIEMGMPDGKMVFDSASPNKPDNPMAAAMASTDSRQRTMPVTCWTRATRIWPGVAIGAASTLQ